MGSGLQGARAVSKNTNFPAGNRPLKRELPHLIRKESISFLTRKALRLLAHNESRPSIKEHAD